MSSCVYKIIFKIYSMTNITMSILIVRNTPFSEQPDNHTSLNFKDWQVFH